MALFRAGELKVKAAIEQLGLARTRFYEVYGDYLQACAQHQQSTWTPGVSGGDHGPAWPAEVDALLHKRLGSKPPASLPARCSGNATSRSIGLRFADGPANTTWPIPNPIAARQLPSGAGSAVASTSSGNWTPRPIAGSPTVPNPFP